jgi:phosphoglucosamine mutase
VDLGVLPTPALASVVRAADYAGAVMVTASHNLAADNGLKVLDRGGDKAGPALREAIEAELAELRSPVPWGPRGAMLSPPSLDAWDPCNGVDLRGLHVVLDAANGAAHRLGRTRLEAAGARVTLLGDGDGRRINLACGAVHPAHLMEAVARIGADAGIALDGDGDRLAMVVQTSDRAGGSELACLDGDAILWVLGHDLPAGGAIVGTIMSNLALEHGLGARGGRLVRTAVGDAEVWAAMQAEGARLGGEPSGHLMFRGGVNDPVGSCGLTTAARVLALGLPTVRDRIASWHPAAQRSGVVHRAALAAGLSSSDSIAARVAPVSTRLLAEGARVVVRPSGTEPIIRVMVEHADATTAQEGCKELMSLLLADTGST